MQRASSSLVTKNQKNAKKKTKHEASERQQRYGHVKRMPEEIIPKLITDWITRERRKRGRPRKTWIEGVQAATTTRNLETDQWEKQRGMAFGFWKTATAVKKKKTGQIDRYCFLISTLFPSVSNLHHYTPLQKERHTTALRYVRGI